METVDEHWTGYRRLFPRGLQPREDFFSPRLTLGYFLVCPRVDGSSSNRFPLALDLSRIRQEGLIWAAVPMSEIA